MWQRDEKGRFVKGKSGNAGGRPKAELCLWRLLREYLRECEPKQKLTRAEVFIKAIVSKACEGDVRAAELLFDRVDGPVVKIESTTIDLETVAPRNARRPRGLAARDARKPAG